MPSIEFNFDQLKSIYMYTLKAPDKAMAFDLKIAQGEFLFMFYLSEEDKESKDVLFVYMRNIKILRKIKMYGNHVKGVFKVYINEQLKEEFIRELQLKHSTGRFDFIAFLTELNRRFPLEIAQQKKIEIMRKNKEIIYTLGITDEPEKTVLIGDKHLSVGAPRDKTLRKLYLYTTANVEDIDFLIKLLKKLNRTVAWTSKANGAKAVDLREMINKLS